MRYPPAVVFDLDGTLVDTELLCNAAGAEACATLGFPVSLAFFDTTTLWFEGRGGASLGQRGHSNGAIRRTTGRT